MTTSSKLFTPVLMIGCIIILVSFAIRASFGLFQIPISTEFDWLRAEFSLALAIQNLSWGIGQPIFGAVAEKIGDRRAIIIGALIYALGLILSAGAISPIEHQFYEILIGFGVAGTGFGVVLAVVGRASSDENRSMSLAVATVAGSGGQVVGPLVASWLLSMMVWQTIFILYAGSILAVLMLLPFMRAPAHIAKADLEDTLRHNLKKACSDPSFGMLFLGFFSCGYFLAFMTSHFPAFVAESCGPIAVGGLLEGLGIASTSALGAAAIAVVGLFNIIGTLAAGYLGDRYPKKYLLSAIYLARTVMATAFILLPMTPLSVLLFSAGLGAVWLASVPLTSGLIGYVYGLRYMGTLYGIIFFSHQLGGFVGVWLGGRLYDVYGNYELVWWLGIAVSAFSALIHLPIQERPLSKVQPV